MSDVGIYNLPDGHPILRVRQLEAENARLRAAARKAHDAMMGWHFAHGNPSALMSPEEAEMGEACKTIAALLDAAGRGGDGHE